MEGEGEGKRKIQLLCPSISSKTVLQITAWENQKLDLGSISRVFGLDPNTVKLNGHFISRGADLLASSVTWKSLISFFAARGLSTGSSHSDALLVHGKFNRIGSKRSYDPVTNENPETSDQGCTRDAKKQQLGYCRLLNSDKLRETNTDETNGLALKRKLCLEDAIPFKRPRTDEVVPGLCERSDGTSLLSRFTCGFISANMKRLRDDETVDTAPLKRLK